MAGKWDRTKTDFTGANRGSGRGDRFLTTDGEPMNTDFYRSAEGTETRNVLVRWRPSLDVNL